ncbi:putative ribonuclease H-like domain-containing protein [Tanacetum coccineum]|uniref:Ribonuclease H-like domain-containing protein n=1 Tax=Tanacetum coccineum TaxID=301880 RepID=A0ABQ5GTJ6_9ASTR
MSQPANDEFSQHLSDDEESNHEDALDTGAAPKQKQQVIPQTTAISNIKLPILKKEEYDIWAMEMEHYLEYIDNDAWKISEFKDESIHLITEIVYGILLSIMIRKIRLHSGGTSSLCSKNAKQLASEGINSIYSKVAHDISLLLFIAKPTTSPHLENEEFSAVGWERHFAKRNVDWKEVKEEGPLGEGESKTNWYLHPQALVVKMSSHMTGNKAYLSDYEDFNRGFVAFGNELKFNLFSISQMCDKKNSVLFIESECLILSPSFKLLDESQVVLRAPRNDDVYSLDLKNTVPSGGITCLYANATADESKLWHSRLGHVNFKNTNKLVKGHLVRSLLSKVFLNDHTCVACKKGKQHKASCKAKLERIIRKPLELLYMDLFGPVSVESINKKRYYLVVTDDFSRFSWVLFLATKDETFEILCKVIIGIENQLNHNVKIIRCDNGTEFKNHAMNEFCAKKGIKREFSVARTPQ